MCCWFHSSLLCDLLPPSSHLSLCLIVRAVDSNVAFPHTSAAIMFIFYDPSLYPAKFNTLHTILHFFFFLLCSMFDVGGQSVERRKWIQCFNGK